MSSIYKLEFLSKYGSDKHKAAIPDKVTHMVHNLPEPNKDAKSWDEPRHDIAQSPMVKGDDLSHLINHEDHSVRYHAAANPNLEKHHIDRIVAHGEANAFHRLATNHEAKLSYDHLHAILDHSGHGAGSYHPAALLGYRKDLHDDHWDKLAKHPHPNVAMGAIMSGQMPMKHLLTAALEHPSNDVVKMARQKRVENLKKGIKD